MESIAFLLPRLSAASACMLPALLIGCSSVFPSDQSELARLNVALEACTANYADLSQADTALQDSLNSLRMQMDDIAADLAGQQNIAVKIATAQPMPVTTELEKLVVGRREKVWVEGLQLALPARIDTGAETASLDARNITPFERDGESWVRFDIPHPKGKGDLTLERPKIRDALIAQASTDAPERRVVIKLGIQLGSVRQLAEFTLSDRGHLDYQMLVGRNILRDVMLVDVSAVNLVPLPESLALKAEQASSE